MWSFDESYEHLYRCGFSCAELSIWTWERQYSLLGTRQRTRLGMLFGDWPREPDPDESSVTRAERGGVAAERGGVHFVVIPPLI